jgi:hypothetical protein
MLTWFLIFFNLLNFFFIFSVLDSSATITSGFILGNNHWIGSQKGCESAQQPLSLAMSDRYHRIMLPDLIQSVAPFNLEYRLVYARHHSKWQIDFKVLAEVRLDTFKKEYRRIEE